MENRRFGNLGKLLAVLFAVVFVASMTSAAMAAEKLTTAKGVVQNVDQAGKTFTLKEKKRDITIAADDNTKVKMGKKESSFSDLQGGEKVSVKYREMDGKYLADTIYIKHHGKAYEKSREHENVHG